MSQIEKLVEKQNALVICRNCGASYPTKNKVCPYCESVNEIGDELDYQEKLEDIREDMEELEHITDDTYEVETKKSIKNVLKIAAIVALVIVFAAVIVFICNRNFEAKKKERVLDELQWQNENYAMLDLLYENEDYDAISEFYNNFYMNDDWTRYSLIEWEHNLFAEVYRDYLYMHECCKNVTNSEEANSRDVGLVFEYIVKIMLTKWDKADANQKLTKTDKQHIEEYKQEAAKILEEHFHISTEELEKMRKDLFNDGGMMVYPDGNKSVEASENLTWYD